MDTANWLLYKAYNLLCHACAVTINLDKSGFVLQLKLLLLALLHTVGHAPYKHACL